jgi:nitrogen fixation/metabolism regulation signal transduction histidine kinase
MMDWFASDNLPYFLQAAALLCLFSALGIFVFFVALPIHRLVLKLAEYTTAHGGGLPGKRFKNDAEVLEAVFKLLTEDLQAKEEELQRLYEQARDRARFMERYNDRVVESVPVAVLGFDAQGDVAGLNSQAEALLHRRQPQVLGWKAGNTATWS